MHKNVFHKCILYRDRLKNMLENVKCEIISMSRNGQVDAYVLSESSMFISQRRFILKTCGTTTPLECIRDLLAMAKLFAGFDGIEVEQFSWVIKVRNATLLLQDIFYSRKNFERPELQLKPHRSFEQEVVLLDEMFADGAAYCLGTLNRYITSLFNYSFTNHTSVTRREAPSISIFL